MGTLGARGALLKNRQKVVAQARRYQTHFQEQNPDAVVLAYVYTNEEIAWLNAAVGGAPVSRSGRLGVQLEYEGGQGGRGDG